MWREKPRLKKVNSGIQVGSCIAAAGLEGCICLVNGALCAPTHALHVTLVLLLDVLHLCHRKQVIDA